MFFNSEFWQRTKSLISQADVFITALTQ